MAGRPIPPHTAVAYQFCDVLDEIAEENRAGSAWAQALASAAINQAAAFFPRAAKSVLGERLIATHKSVADTLSVKQKVAPADDFDRLGQQFAEAGRARAMAAGADKAAVLKAMQTSVAQLSGVQPQARALTDQGASTLKESSPFAAAFQGDLRSDMTPR